MIVILKACQREIVTFPEEIRGDLADALARLDAGLALSTLQEDDAGHGCQEPGPGQDATKGGSVMKKRTPATRLARQLGIAKGRGIEAVVKARLIAAIVQEVERRGFTHAELAVRSGLPRSAVTGILSGSLQKVTIDRVLRLLEAAGLEADIRVRRAA